MRRFYLLRVLRIYPLHIVLMLCLLLVVVTLPDFVGWMRAQRSPEVFSAAGFWQTIFLVQNWSGYNEAVWNAPAWTLSAEVLGYIAFPFLAYEVLRRTSGRSAAAWGSAVLLALIAATLLSGRATVNPNGGFGLVRMATEFFAGLCLWRYFDSAPGRERHFGLLASVAAAAVLLLCLNAYAAVWTPLAFAALILGLAYRSGLAYRLLSHRSIVWLGEVSYSFYLVHWSVIQLLLWARDDRLLQLPALALTWLAVGAFCLALSWLTYRYVEQPAHRLGHRLARRPMRQATDRTGTAEAQSLEAVVRE
jgi:peptidoglycan/LPS O-acetylase OafA/YrhL